MKWSLDYDRKKRIRPVELGDLDAMLDACGKSITGTRNRAILAVLFYAGLRSQEVLDLRPCDVTFNEDGSACLRVGPCKGGVGRVAKLYRHGTPFLIEWMDARSKWATDDALKPVFCTHSSGVKLAAGSPMFSSYLRRMIYRVRDRICYEGRLHPHAFRYGHMKYLHEEGMSMWEIADQVGHESPEVTLYYMKEVFRAEG